MKNKYITSRQILFTKCELELKCILQDLEPIATKLKKYAPKFNIFYINSKEANILVRMECTFINKPTEDGLKTMEEEIDNAIEYLKKKVLEVSQINFSHRIDEDYIPL